MGEQLYMAVRRVSALMTADRELGAVGTYFDEEDGALVRDMIVTLGRLQERARNDIDKLMDRADRMEGEG